MPTGANTAAAHKARAIALAKARRYDDALAELQNALRLKPRYPEAYYNIAMIHMARKNAGEAAANWRKAIELKPDYVQAYSSLGVALRQLGKIEESLDACRQAVRLMPNDIGSRLNLATALQSARKYKEADAEFQLALKRDPKNARALNNYGNLLAEMDQPVRAEVAYRQALLIDPKLFDVYINLGGVMTAQGYVNEAIDCYRKNLAAHPDSWELHSNLLLALNYSPASDDGLLREHVEWADKHATKFYPKVEPVFPNDRSPERKIRIGYVSGDLRRHSVAYFLEPILASHDRSQVEVFCYSNVGRPDDVTQRIRESTEHWREIVGLPDDRAAQMIRDDQIDILVDIGGHTSEQRLLVFARKPAPVQVTYLGYPNTTGLRTIDYRLADEQCDPLGVTESHYVETLVRLPHGMWCFRPSDLSPLPRETPSADDAPVVFGSFNFLGKVTPHMLRLWARILQQVPHSKLIIKAESFSDAEMRQATRSSFAEYGADPSSLELPAREPSFKKHLSHYQQMDIALDTFPYNGTTTTCEAMWMGVPVVTLAGHAHLSRVGASLLTRVGLPSLVAQSPEEYVDIAVELAEDAAWRREISGMHLRRQMQSSPLMDGPAFARDLESAYRQMWRTWCSK